jgi:hypothetical protein
MRRLACAFPAFAAFAGLAAFAAFAALVASTAFAARPLTTEDSATLEDDACQLEAWVDRGISSTQSWLVPACNFGAGIQWQAGFARSREDGASGFSETYLQAKKELRAIGDSFWGAGIVAGVARHPRRETHRGWENPYVTIPLSATPDHGKTLFHFNAGWSHDRAERRNVTTWGVAVERAIAARLTLVAEAFGENTAPAFLRAGARWNAAPSVAFDLTMVMRAGGTRDERYVSLGMFVQTPSFMP